MKDSEDSRSDFYQQSFGFGIMDQYFEQPPRVYTFSEASVQNLENTSQWTIHILRPEHGHSNDYDAALARQSAWRKQHPESVLASETQKEEHIERWYPGNDFDEAFVAIVGTNHGQSDETMSSSSGYEHEQSKVELTIYHKEEIPDSSSLKAPLTIAELIDVPPVAYGLSRGDDFPYAETAHPMSLSFWSMARLYDPSQSDLSRFESAENSLASPISSEFPFLGDASSPSSPVLSTSEETMYYKAIIQVRLKVKLTESKTLDDIRDVIGLLGELQGLLELRALKRQDDDTEMSFFASKNSAYIKMFSANCYVKFGKPLQTLQPLGRAYPIRIMKHQISSPAARSPTPGARPLATWIESTGNGHPRRFWSLSSSKFQKTLAPQRKICS